MDSSFKAGHEVCDVNLRTVTSGQRGMVGLCCVFFCRDLLFTWKYCEP